MGKVKVFKQQKEVKKPNTNLLLRQQLQEAIQQLNRLIEMRR